MASSRGLVQCPGAVRCVLCFSTAAPWACLPKLAVVCWGCVLGLCAWLGQVVGPAQAHPAAGGSRLAAGMCCGPVAGTSHIPPSCFAMLCCAVMWRVCSNGCPPVAGVCCSRGMLPSSMAARARGRSSTHLRVLHCTSQEVCTLGVFPSAFTHNRPAPGVQVGGAVLTVLDSMGAVCIRAQVTAGAACGAAGGGAVMLLLLPSLGCRCRWWVSWGEQPGPGGQHTHQCLAGSLPRAAATPVSTNTVCDTTVCVRALHGGCCVAGHCSSPGRFVWQERRGPCAPCLPGGPVGRGRRAA